MEAKNILTLITRQEFRTWLEENSDKEKECWIVAKRGKEKPKIIFGSWMRWKKHCASGG